jgi:hypothetical protein
MGLRAQSVIDLAHIPNGAQQFVFSSRTLIAAIINDGLRRVKQTMLCNAAHHMTCRSIFPAIRVPS